MNVITKDGREIDVTPWLETMRENSSHGRHIFDNTPIGSTADREYFWWDEESNPPLSKSSVNKLIKFVGPSIPPDVQ